MASAILHIKDSYYFDVPKSFWRPYTSLDQIPGYLKDAHRHATLDDFNRDLAGKILIPQPFGTPRNLYEPGTGFSITRFMVIEVVVAVLLAFIFIGLARRLKHGAIARGSWWNLWEAGVYFVRDQIAKPAIGDHDADRFVPFLWTMFFFIAFCNLAGMFPWVGAPTSAFSVTLTLGGLTLLTGMICGIFKFGFVGYWLNQIPHMDLPWWMAPIKAGLFIIEVASLLVKHAILGVRLLANMIAGHVVLFAIMAMAFSIEGARSESWAITAPIAILGSVALSMLELFVALLQAYVFTFLSALFIGAAVHHH